MLKSFVLLLLVCLNLEAALIQFEDSTTANLNPYTDQGFEFQGWSGWQAGTPHSLTANVNEGTQFNNNQNYVSFNFFSFSSPGHVTVTYNQGQLFDLNSLSLGSTQSNIFADIELRGYDDLGGIIASHTFNNYKELTHVNVESLGFVGLSSLQMQGLNSGFSIDNFDAEASVPEPSSFSLGILGLLGLMFRKKRVQRN